MEGDAGVGKTEVAKVLAHIRSARLIRLQCYEGLDAHAAMYEWNYQRQLLAIKLLEQDERSVAAKEQDIFSERYLLKRPLLEAISCETPPVLLIDEVDRADEAFEAYLLELLSDFQMSIPELGTVTATSVPLVVVTSNGTRISDRRAAAHQYVDYPSPTRSLIAALRARRGRRAARQTCSSAGRPPHGARQEAGHRRDTRLDRGAAAPRRDGAVGRPQRPHPRNARRTGQDARGPLGVHARGRRADGGRMLIAAATAAPRDVTAMLGRRLSGFGSFLRANGFDVGGGDAARVIDTAARVGVLDRDAALEHEGAARHRVTEWCQFDALFDAYFPPPNVFTAGAVDTPCLARRGFR